MVTGTGGGGAGSANNHGVFVDQTGQISAGGAGNVSVVGIQGDPAAEAIRFDDSSFMSGDGQISLDGTGDILITDGSSIQGLGDLTINTTGIATFDVGTTSTYDGTTMIESGRTNVDGLIDNDASVVTVKSGATLGGNGTVDRPVVVEPSGTLAPGLSPGVVTVDSVSFTAGSTFEIEIDGPTPGIGAGFHDQLVVSDTLGDPTPVELNNATLDFSATLPADYVEYIIIDNQGSDPVTGQFAGLPEGFVVAL